MSARDIALWILILLAIIISLWYIFGSSPSFEQTILVLILTILFSIYSKISDVNARLFLLEKKFNKLEESFINLVRDFKEHTKHMRR